MARSRNIKPGFFSNEYLADLDPLARILFAGLWCLADREGRLEDRPKKIKAELLPYDDCDVEKLLDDLMNADEQFIIRYEAQGNRYIQITNFEKHQNPHKREVPSVIPPAPKQDQSDVLPRTDQGRTKDMTSPVISGSSPADSLNLIPDSLNTESDADAVPEKSVGTKAVGYVEQAWGRPISPGEAEVIMKWCDDFSVLGSSEADAVVIEGIKRGMDHNVKTLAYLSGILKNWYDSGIKSVNHITTLDAEWKAKKDKGKGMAIKTGETKPGKGKYEEFYLS